MRPITRIAFTIAALTLGAAARDLGVRSPDPEPVPVITPEPVEPVITAPADEPPTAAAPGDSEPAAAAPIENAGTAGATAPAVETVPLEPPPPAAPTVDSSATYWPPRGEDEPPPSQKPSDWVFLGIVVLAILIMAVRLAREQAQRVSIQDDRIPPSPAGPPVVRHP